MTLAPITTQSNDARLGQFFQSAVRAGIPRKRLPASLRYPDRVRYITTIDRGRAVHLAYNNTIQPPDELTNRLQPLRVRQ